MLSRNTLLFPALWLLCCCMVVACDTPTPYKRSDVYTRVVKDISYPADNDAAYAPPKGYVPKIKPYYEDNDTTYTFPKGRLARTPRQPYPQDNDATYTFPRGYKSKPGGVHHYPDDNDANYQYPRGKPPAPSRDEVYGNYPRDNESDMLDIYPLYMD